MSGGPTLPRTVAELPGAANMSGGPTLPRAVAEPSRDSTLPCGGRAVRGGEYVRRPSCPGQRTCPAARRSPRAVAELPEAANMSRGARWPPPERRAAGRSGVARCAGCRSRPWSRRPSVARCSGCCAASAEPRSWRGDAVRGADEQRAAALPIAGATNMFRRCPGRPPRGRRTCPTAPRATVASRVTPTNMSLPEASRAAEPTGATNMSDCSEGEQSAASSVTPTNTPAPWAADDEHVSGAERRPPRGRRTCPSGRWAATAASRVAPTCPPAPRGRPSRGGDEHVRPLRGGDQSGRLVRDADERARSVGRRDEHVQAGRAARAAEPRGRRTYGRLAVRPLREPATPRRATEPRRRRTCPTAPRSGDCPRPSRRRTCPPAPVGRPRGRRTCPAGRAAHTAEPRGDEHVRPLCGVAAPASPAASRVTPKNMSAS